MEYQKVLSVIIGLTIVLTAAAVLPAPANKLLPTGVGVNLPAIWPEIVDQLLVLGVIDSTKLQPTKDRKIIASNAGVMLNTLWAFGLANKNRILTEGPMTDPQYGGDPSRFASTGGWTAAVGDVMDHYGHHSLVVLTADEQVLVEKVAKDIYRPCCSNSAYFPDCNHGMAMLGLLELLASDGASETQMRSAAAGVNAYWFPELNANSCAV